MPSQGIVISTSEYTKDFLVDCINSCLQEKYTILVVSNGGYQPRVANKAYKGIELVINDWNGFEFGGILRGKERFDQFIHLADSTVVKDKSLFDKLFAIPGHVWLTKGPHANSGYHVMGKFTSNDLPEIPIVNDKEAAINQELHWMNSKPCSYFEPDLPAHTNVFEEKYGQKRMILENQFLKKFKGTWRI